MKIGFVTVYVADFKNSLDFYTKSLEMEIDYTDDKNWAAFKSGVDVSLSLEKCDPNRMEQGSKLCGRRVGVTLMVDDIENTYEKLLSKGVDFTAKPAKQHWGGILADLKDPEGNILTLMQEQS